MRKALLLALAVAGLAAAAASSHSAASSHPRIFLDRSTLAALRARARAGTAEWRSLAARCNAFLTSHVEWPDGNDYPESNSIGEGYQGDGYLPAVLALGLCYQTELGLSRDRAAAYGRKGAELLEKMSAPAGSPHAPDVTRDDVYGIRNYGVGLAVGFDWLHDALSAGDRARVIAALHRWISTFEETGFERDFPQGNYFAGYYDAKALAALATEGEDPAASREWQDWLGRVHGRLVQPYYARNLSGGGWPEGWNYGAFGTLHQSWPVLAALTAKRLDLVRKPGAPYAFPLNAARFLLWFTWPDLQTMEDSNFAYDSDNPTPTHRWLLTFESALLARWHDPLAPYSRSYASAVRSVRPGGEFGPNWDPAFDFLFWAPSAPERDYRRLPRSYYAKGMEMAAVRSSWRPDAVWAQFKAGPFTNYRENGEQLFDEGSLAIVNGARPLLVNAWGALVRNTPGTNDGSALYDKAGTDVFADNGPRDLFNVFSVDRPAPPGQGRYLRADGARTRIDRFEDGGAYVLMRGSQLEDDYPRQDGAPKTI